MYVYHNKFIRKIKSSSNRGPKTERTFLGFMIRYTFAIKLA